MLKYVDNMKTGYKQFINILNHANMLKLLKSIVRMLKYCRIVWNMLANVAHIFMYPCINLLIQSFILGLLSSSSSIKLLKII